MMTVAKEKETFKEGPRSSMEGLLEVGRALERIGRASAWKKLVGPPEDPGGPGRPFLVQGRQPGYMIRCNISSSILTTAWVPHCTMYMAYIV